MKSVDASNKGTIRLVCVERLFARFMACAPVRIKRLLFVASFAAIVDDIKHSEPAYEQKLNELLQLAHRDGALFMPISVSGWIWKDLAPTQEITLSKCSMTVKDLRSVSLTEDLDFLEIAKFAISAAPKWLVYDTLENIARDVKMLLQSPRLV